MMADWQWREILGKQCCWAPPSGMALLAPLHCASSAETPAHRENLKPAGRGHGSLICRNCLPIVEKKLLSLKGEGVADDG